MKFTGRLLWQQKIVKVVKLFGGIIEESGSKIKKTLNDDDDDDEEAKHLK